MFLIIRKHRISFFAFCLVVGVFFSSVSGNVKATGVEVEISIDLLLRLVGACGKDYVEDRISEQLDPAYYHDVVSSSSYPNWEDPDSVQKYINGKGDVHQLATTWNELNKQYELYSGVVDKEYFQAFYEALINNIVDDANFILDEVQNNYVNSPFHYSRLNDDEKNAFYQYPFYIVAQYRNIDTGVYNDSVEIWFCSDLRFGICNSCRKCENIYYYNYGLVDVGACSTVKSNGVRNFSSSVVSRQIITNLDSKSDHTYNLLYTNGFLSKIDGVEVSYDSEHGTGNGCFKGGYKELYNDGSVFSGYVVKNVGITPLGHDYLNGSASSGVELQRTLDKYKDIENPLPIFVYDKNVDTYVGNDTDDILHIDYDNDIVPQFIVNDDTDTVTLQNDDDLNNLDTSPVCENDVATKKWGWLSFLFNWFQKIIDAILSLVNGIVDGILDGLKGLFVPSDDFFTSNFSSIKDKFAEKFGFSDYELFFDALKNCAKGAWNFEFTFHVAEKEYTLAIANVDEWFKETNLSKIHFLMRGFFYPLMILANVNYMIWFLRGSYLISPTKSSDG